MGTVQRYEYSFIRNFSNGNHLDVRARKSLRKGAALTIRLCL